jgi:hypothetical protein
MEVEFDIARPCSRGELFPDRYHEMGSVIDEVYPGNDDFVPEEWMARPAYFDDSAIFGMGLPDVGLKLR